jgi:hypothetical protein
MQPFEDSRSGWAWFWAPIHVNRPSAGQGGDNNSGGADQPMQVLYVVYTASQTLNRERECYDRTHDSTYGSAVRFFSMLSYTPLNPESGSSWSETARLGTVKVVAVEGGSLLGDAMVNSSSTGLQIIGTSLSGITAGIKALTKVAGPLLTATATAIDAPIVGACTTLGYIQQLVQPY